ncbi:MAG: DUF11 domain-containing protein, partial [Thermoplasmata archaeon]|nr:DUF11 domain-containing protein [Thermoplasmata archaeon]
WNNGSKTASVVRIEDILPIGVTYLADSCLVVPWVSGNRYIWRIYNVPPGAYSFLLWVRVDSNVGNGVNLVNNVWCNYTLDNGYTITDGDDFAITTITRPIITVVKTVDKPVASPGDYLYYTIYYTNTGGRNARNVWINDTIPLGVIFSPDATTPPPYWAIGRAIYWRFTNVAPGNHSFTFRVRILDHVANGTVLTNWAFLNYTCPVRDGPDLKLGESHDRADTIVGLPIINIEKVANVNVANPGDTIVYTIYYNNTGLVDALFVTITDILPFWVTYLSDTSGVIPSVFGSDTYIWELGTVLANSQNSFTITVNISTDDALPDNELLVNYATCTYYIQNGLSWETTDTAEVLVIKPVIELIKEVNEYITNPYNILVYTIEFNNLGSDDAAFLWLNDTLPSGVTFLNHTAANVTGATLVSSNITGLHMWFNFTDVSPGAHSFLIYVRVNASASDGTILINLVTCDYTANNNLSYEQESDYAISIVVRPLIVIQKTVNQSAADLGEYLLYTLYFNNTASGTAPYVWINDTLPLDVIYINHTVANTTLHTLVSMGVSGQYLWFNFTDVRPGTHSLTIVVRIDANATTSLLVNNATLEYSSLAGLRYEPSYDIAMTIVSVIIGPPMIFTTPPAFVYAGRYFNITALVEDDLGILEVIIYYIDINGTLHSVIMSPLFIDLVGRGYYVHTVSPQMWKGIVTYQVWALDTSYLSNKTGWYDIEVLLPPYYVWGDVFPSENEPVVGSMVIVINNQTNDSVFTMVDTFGRYIVDLAKFSSGYVDGQNLMVFAIDANLEWYGYNYGTIDILRYINNPQLPPGITDSAGDPFHRIDVYLTEIPEFMNIILPVIIILTVAIYFRRKRGRMSN